MKATPFALFALALLVSTGCQDSTEPPDEGTESNVVVRVNALELTDVSDACYSITVTNADGDTMTDVRDVCSTSHGDGAGSATYVGTCDATANPNTVTLSLDSLFDDAGNRIDPADYVNPCPPGAPCAMTTECAENLDTPVNFDLTILRELGVGFFDIAVDFDDIFCSAKLDCVDFAGGPIELVYFQGERQPTTVLAFACTDGGGATTIYRDVLTLDCGDDGTFTIDPTTGGDIVGVAHWEVYTGTATSSAGPDPIGTAFWNIGLVAEPGFTGTCSLSTTVTATGEPAPDGVIPAGHPLIRTDAPLYDGSNVPICGRNALGGDGSAVTAEINPADRTFDASYPGE